MSTGAEASIGLGTPRTELGGVVKCRFNSPFFCAYRRQDCQDRTKKLVNNIAFGNVGN